MAVAVRPVDMISQVRTLVQRIKQGMCILFIGPGLLRTRSGEQLNSAFALSLAKELREDHIDFDDTQEQNMAYMIQHYIQAINLKNNNNSLKIIDLRSKFIEFVKDAELDTSLYEKLARIPFRLVLNTNYDNLFYGLLQKNFPAAKVQFDYYDISNQSPTPGKEKIVSPSSNNFVVYNLFGLCGEDSLHSQILTEKEFVRFVCRIHQPNTHLPLEITNHIDQNKYCLFLGFDFDQWYLKVVVRALWHGSHADSEKERENPDTLVLSLPPYPTAFFYESAYKFYFSNNGLDQLLDNILLQLYPPKSVQEVNLPGLPGKVKEPDTPNEPINIFFISDIKSKEDNQYRNQISNQLEHLKDKEYAARWSEDMTLGDNKMTRLTEMIQEADIIIALVSVDFMCGKKMDLIKRVLAENNKPELKKLAVLLRPCVEGFQDMFIDFTWMPEKRENGRPLKALNEFSSTEQEKTIAVIAEIISQHVYEIIK